MSKTPAKKEQLDLSNLSLHQLRALMPNVKERIVELEETKCQKAFEKMEAAAAEVGMTAEELLKFFKKKEKKKTLENVAPKYKNPNNPEETWSGRGRKPAWIESWLKAGKDLKALEAA